MTDGPWQDYAQPEAPAAPPPSSGPWQAYQGAQPAAVTVPDQIPDALFDRLTRGTFIDYTIKELSAAIPAFKETFGTEPLGFSDEHIKQLQQLGIYADPETGRAGPVRFMNQAIMDPSAAVFDAIARGFSATAAGAGAFFGKAVELAGGSEGSAESAKNEVTNFAQYLMLRGDHPISRVDHGPTGMVTDQQIGTLPRSEDFANAASTVGGQDAPFSVQQKLLKAYTDHGLHPSEVAHDAQTDPVVAQRLLSSDPNDLPGGQSPISVIRNDDKVVGTKSVDVYYGPPDNAQGQIIGQIHGDSIKVKLSTLGEESRGQGVGVAMYEKLIDYANQNGLKVESDGEVSADAAHVYDALERRGYTVDRNPNVTVDADGKLYADQGSVFEVSGGGDGGKPPAEPPAPPEPGSFDEAERKILDKISVGDTTPAEPYTLAKFYRQAVDDLYPLKGVDADAYQLARLTRGQFGKAEHFLEHGTFDFDTYQTNGKPLSEVLAPVANDLYGFRAYLASKRALEIEASGRTSGMDVDAAQRVAAAGEAKYGPVAQELYGYQDRLLSYLKQSGVLSDEAVDAMREAGKSYIPFYRVMRTQETGKGAGSSFGPANPVKRLKGSGRDIIDPLESVIKNTYAYVSIAERNAVGIKLIDALKKDGAEVSVTGARDPELVKYLQDNGVSNPNALVDFVKSAIPEDGDTLSAFRDGVKETVKVDDPELVRAFRGLDQSSADMLTRVLAVPAKALRAGAVLSPDFITRNIVRDFLTAFVNTGRGLFTPIDTAKGLVSVIRKDSDFLDWLKGGGANSTMVALDRRYMQESLEKLTEQTGLMDRAWNVVKSPLAGLRMLSELAENATRLGEFKRLTGASKEDIQNAAFASREVTLDFARIGASMRASNQIIAFMNAQLQGLDRIGRQFKDRPVNTLAKVAGGITLPSVLLWWANHDDPRWQEIPHWQKDLFWLVMTKDHIYRIPKPFELGVVFGSGVERILDATIAKNPDAFDDLGSSIMNVITPSYVPTAVLPMVEQFANRSTFIDRTLIPADQEKYLPEYQYTPYTTELTKKLGRIISAFPGMRETAVGPGAPFGPMARAMTSPILMENYIRAWTGGLGVYALQAADAGLRKAGVLPDPVQPAATLADIPVVKAFVVRYPSASAQSIQDFYDQADRDAKFYDTWNAKAQEGDAEAMQRIQAAGGPAMFARLDAIKETLGEHSKLVRDIWKNPTIPADQKRQLIDSLYFNMIEIARNGKEMIRATH